MARVNLRPRLRIIGWLLILGTALNLLIFAAAGCGAKKASRETAPVTERIDVYTVADTTGDWGFPSPYAHYSRGPGYVRMSFIFDTLVWKDDRGYVPALAESWEYLEDENAYLFKLRKDVTWHDGERFTAEDVAFTIDYIKQHPYQWVDSSIIKKAEVVDEDTVKIYLSKPYAPFVDNVACTLPILPEHIWKDVQDPEQFQEEKAVVGTGPFKLVDYNKAQGTYLYEAYDDYYLGKPKVKQLRFVKISEEMAASALKQKQVHAAGIPSELVEAMKKEGFTVIGTHDWNAKLMINHKKPPFNEKRFRQALAYAIDREEIVATCLRGHGLVGNPGFVLPDSPWYNPEAEQYRYSPTKAQEIMESLGYVKKDGYYQKDGKVLELELLVAGGTGSPGEREGEMIEQQLEKVGIKVNLRSVESKTRDNLVNEWKFDLALSGHGGIGGDPDFLNRSIIGQGFNSARYTENETLVNLLKQQQQAMDERERKGILAEIQKLYAEEVPALTLYYPTSYWAFNEKVIKLFYTRQGIAIGVPIPLNKLAFVK
ncbi:MAG: Glutathione ABC transport system substrate protein GsiD [Thermacetogenium phaeum]|uniref:Glutathione ABC transport system substrate protein GsiD n=1 Tax=Thermacetogenium phaeum TaxID=85874 RepID=A0A101FGS2_9THEO|nr:MAG: Glutathione ABC transport system substrate protein GsiD [Thermacetogenium phaeum]